MLGYELFVLVGMGILVGILSFITIFIEDNDSIAIVGIIIAMILCVFILFSVGILINNFMETDMYKEMLLWWNSEV